MDPRYPDQWYRFLLPMFLHGGILHLALNSWIIYRTAHALEIAYGPVRVGIVYVASGIGGTVLSSNFGDITRTLLLIVLLRS